MGPKRGRLLIRQPRVKRDSDNTTTGGGSAHSPDTDFEAPFSQRLLTVPQHSTLSSVHTQHLHQPQLLHQHSHPAAHHHHHHHHAKIERHASEPAPSNMSTITSAHLLSVPSQSPFLVKQHSHPLLLPSQSSLDMSGSGPSTVHYMHRQLSYVSPNDTSSLSLLMPVSSVAPIISSAASSVVTQLSSSSSSSSSNLAPTTITTTTAAFIDRPVKSEDQPDVVLLKAQAISPSIVVVADPTPSAETMPTIRVKSEELQRSLSTPQPIRELSLENRSQHCPVIRPGPALGCNYCWNTIDAHGRILRRKTKYHCPECQTNLCIVPCFQEYHERQSTEAPSSAAGADDGNIKHRPLPSYSLRQYPKTGGSM